MSKQKREYDEGFSDGVILALQMMAADGDGGGTGYVELLKTAGEEKIIARAKNQRLLRLSGLSTYLREKRSNEKLSGPNGPRRRWKMDQSSRAVVGPFEPTVGRPVDEATDADGPRGTYGCACVARDSVECAAIRYGMDHWGEACQCLCHQWDDDDDSY